MKKYIFLTYAVTGIGGTQIYLRNKINFLQSRGWQIFVFATESANADNKVYIKELEPFVEWITPDLIKNPFILTRKERESILNRLEQGIGKADEIVIESNYVQVTLWGEILAQRLEAKHFIFFIQEDYRLNIPQYIEFYKFKYLRGELAANTDHALAHLFDNVLQINASNNCHLPATCSNSIEDCETNLCDVIKSGYYHIGSLGRINKPFVLPTLVSIGDFAKTHPADKFQVIYFGYASDPLYQTQLEEVADKVDNLEIFVTGPIYPVPLSMLKKMDVFISSSGSATATSKCGFLTIAIDGQDLEPIGFVGINTHETLHRANSDEKIKLKDLLEEALYEKKNEKTQINCDLEVDMAEKFSPHLDFIEMSSHVKEYYEIKRLQPKLITRICKHLLGEKIVEYMFQIKNCFEQRMNKAWKKQK